MSTGVYIAMKSAFLGADVVTAFLHRLRAEADRALRRFETEIRDALARFSWYIYRVNTPAMRDLFMVPHNYFRMPEALLSLYPATCSIIRRFAPGCCSSGPHSISRASSCGKHDRWQHGRQRVPAKHAFRPFQQPGNRVSGGSVNTARPPRRHDHPLGAGTQLQYRRETISHCRGHPSTGMGCDVFQHRLATIAEAGCLHRGNL